MVMPKPLPSLKVSWRKPSRSEPHSRQDSRQIVYFKIHSRHLLADSLFTVKVVIFRAGKIPVFCIYRGKTAVKQGMSNTVFHVILSRFLRNKRDILLSLQHDYKTIMTIAKEIKRRIAEFSEDYVFTASDFEIESQNQSAVVKALNRMVKSGEIL